MLRWQHKNVRKFFSDIYTFFAGLTIQTKSVLAALVIHVLFLGLLFIKSPFSSPLELTVSSRSVKSSRLKGSAPVCFVPSSGASGSGIRTGSQTPDKKSMGTKKEDINKKDKKKTNKQDKKEQLAQKKLAQKQAQITQESKKKTSKTPVKTSANKAHEKTLDTKVQDTKARTSIVALPPVLPKSLKQNVKQDSKSDPKKDLSKKVSETKSTGTSAPIPVPVPVPPKTIQKTDAKALDRKDIQDIKDLKKIDLKNLGAKEQKVLGVKDLDIKEITQASGLKQDQVRVPDNKDKQDKPDNLSNLDNNLGNNIDNKNILEDTKLVLNSELINMTVYANSGYGFGAEAEARYVQLQEALIPHWTPPIGIDSAISCRLRAKINEMGGATEVTIVDTSGVLMYDIAARTALLSATMPRWARGHTVVIAFTQ